jgi:hypothetical protein
MLLAHFTVAVIVTLCPGSMAAGERTSVGAARAGLTVTTAIADTALDPFAPATVPQ